MKTSYKKNHFVNEVKYYFINFFSSPCITCRPRPQPTQPAGNSATLSGRNSNNHDSPLIPTEPNELRWRNVSKKYHQILEPFFSQKTFFMNNGTYQIIACNLLLFPLLFFAIKNATLTLAFIGFIFCLTNAWIRYSRMFWEVLNLFLHYRRHQWRIHQNQNAQEYQRNFSNVLIMAKWNSGPISVAFMPECKRMPPKPKLHSGWAPS